jgi:tetratricopeptide (TPR) repeat protein
MDPGGGFAGRPGQMQDLTNATKEINGAAAAAAGMAQLGLDYERGAAVGRYLILERIGQGGMGVVYKAHDPQLDRMVALKLLKVWKGEAQAAERLNREAQALARLAHPNVVAIYDAGVTDGVVFLAMELVEGKTLRQWSAARKRPWREVLSVLLAAGEGLTAAHRAGIVHRDFKPDNVIVGADGRVRVLDFGLARAADQPEAARAPLDDAALGDGDLSPSRGERSRLSTPVTLAGQVMGTPRYMALEQHLGQPANAKSDQFSFAVALYEALYGQRPFAGRDSKELQASLQRGPIPPPADAAVPARLWRALRPALSPRPEERYGALADLLQALAHDALARVRRWAPALAAAAILGGGLVVVRGGARVAAPPQPCTAGAKRIAEVWNGERRSVITRAFAGTGLIYADAAAHGASDRLDAYARDWATIHRETCEATRVRGEQSEALLDLRMRCLDERREQLSVLVDVLSAADATVVGRAVPAAQSLPPLAACSDAEALEAKTPLPKDPAVRARIEVVRDVLARARAQFLAGRYREAMTLVAPVVDEADQLGYAPLEAEVQVLHGGLLDRAERYEDARRAYWQAIAAADSGRVDDVRAEAELQLMWIIGERLGHYDEAREWATQARGVIARLRRPAGPQAKYHRVLGVLAYRQGRYSEALDEAAAALVLAREAFGEAHSYVATCENDLAIAHHLLGHQRQAEEHGARALAIWVELFGDEHPDVAVAHENLGEIELAQGRRSEAAAHYERAAVIFERLGSPMRGHALIGLGESYESMGRSGEAETVFAEAARALEGDPRGQAGALLGLGRMFLLRRDFAGAVPLLERALAARGGEGDPFERAEVELELARALLGTGRDPARVRKLGREARAAFVAAGPRGTARIGEVDALLAEVAESQRLSRAAIR